MIIHHAHSEREHIEASTTKARNFFVKNETDWHSSASVSKTGAIYPRQ